jgi:hypothetical protein
MLNVNALRPLKHYLPKDLMSFGDEGHGQYITKVTPSWSDIKQCEMKYKI